MNEVIKNVDVFMETMNKYDFRTFEYVRDKNATNILAKAADIGFEKVKEAWITPIQKALIDKDMDE